jgi:predicted component of type VI protein secretion system
VLSSGSRWASEDDDGTGCLSTAQNKKDRDMADMVSKLPGLEDKALATLLANAERLCHSGTIAQQTAAAAMLTAVQAEVAARKAAKAVALRQRMEARRPPRRSKADNSAS